MPFKSEKQRRFLWAEHPEIAKRWAHEYPEANKHLPLYAHKAEPKKEPEEPIAKKEKTAEFPGNNGQAPHCVNNGLKLTVNDLVRNWRKNAGSLAQYVEMPSGQEVVNREQLNSQPENVTPSMKAENTVQNEEKASEKKGAEKLMKKLAVVLAPKLMQEIENENALLNARKAQNVPENVGLSNYSPAPSGSILPPAPPVNSPMQQVNNSSQGQQNPDATPSLAGVGGGNSPNANPINSFGGLSVNGDINGNAAFGTQNSMGGEKLAFVQKWAKKRLGLWDRIRMKKERGEKPAQPGDKDYPDAKSWKKVTGISEKESSSPAWQRSEGKNEAGGLNAKGRASYNKATGGHLKAPVTEKHPTGKAKARRHSFCSRMCGMKRVNTGSKTKSDPDSRINKALRKWNCKCSSAVSDLVKMADGYMLGPAKNPDDVRLKLQKLFGQPKPAIKPKPATYNPAPDKPGTTPGYLGVLDRWYNPYTKQQVTERGETGLMRGGRAAMGTGAALGTAAAGLAAAPALTSAVTSMPTQAAALGAGVSNLGNSAYLKAQNAAQQAGQLIPKPLQNGFNWYQRNLVTPANQNPAMQLNVATARGNGDPTGFMPTSVSLPLDIATRAQNSLRQAQRPQNIK